MAAHQASYTSNKGPVGACELKASDFADYPAGDQTLDSIGTDPSSHTQQLVLNGAVRTDFPVVVGAADAWCVQVFFDEPVPSCTITLNLA